MSRFEQEERKKVITLRDGVSPLALARSSTAAFSSRSSRLKDWVRMFGYWDTYWRLYNSAGKPPQFSYASEFGRFSCAFIEFESLRPLYFRISLGSPFHGSTLL